MQKLPSKDQILQLIEYLPVLDKARNDLAARLKAADNDHELLQPGLAWGTCYDLPVCVHFGWLTQRGVPLNVIQEMGAWESAEMVRRYAHLAPEQFALHAGVVDEVLKNHG